MSGGRRSLVLVEAESHAWNPWAAVRDRDDIEIMMTALPAACGGAVHAITEWGTVILLDDHLSTIERNAVLAHELVHAERGGLVDGPAAPPTWGAIVAKEEAAVRRITAERLVPLGELAHLVTVLDDMGQGVSAFDVAEHFGVTEGVAATAMEMLAREGYGDRWAG
jgi:hypothetical protein